MEDSVKLTKEAKNLGQYFTTSVVLKEKMYSFILNSPERILEPSVGRGDLVSFVKQRIPEVCFDMFEIDSRIKMLDDVEQREVIYGDFLLQKISKTYKTIIGNPPYVRTKTGNLYIDFISKCYELLSECGGELVFLVPSDFFKLTSASKLLKMLMETGSFTHIFHPNNERFFSGANIDVLVFRYCKGLINEKKVLYNDTTMFVCNKDGLLTFNREEELSNTFFEDYFDIYVGIVSGKEAVYKNDELGNILVLNGKDKIEKYIYIENFPSKDQAINEYLIKFKQDLMSRKIKKFNEENWFEWGAMRNVGVVNEKIGEDCIYIHTLTRNAEVAFTGKVRYFGGGLLMLVPKKKYNLELITSYINSSSFKNNFMFSGRFKIGHRQISNSKLPAKYSYSV